MWRDAATAFSSCAVSLRARSCFLHAWHGVVIESVMPVGLLCEARYRHRGAMHCCRVWAMGFGFRMGRCGECTGQVCV